MTRVAVPVSALSLNGGTVNAGTAIDTSNGHVLTLPNDKRVLIEVDNTGTVAASTVTLKAGDNPPAFLAGAGDLAVAVGTAGKHRGVIIIETARFMQDDGTINIDAAGFSAGTIAAYSLPRSF
jgi:hypothetical protein